MATAETQPLDESSPRPRPGGGWKPLAALLGGLALLIVLRAVLAHGDPTDFPLDRNITSAWRIDALEQGIARDGLIPTVRNQVLRRLPDTPELPFMPVGAWAISRLHGDPIVAGRIFSLLASALTGLALFILGRRVGPWWVGALALGLFALAPMAIFMGRTLLPDPFMLAAATWSLVAAGAGLPRLDQPGPAAQRRALLRAGWMALLLVTAVLAKLPAVLLAPAAAVALMGRLGWRRRGAWIALAAAALLTYAAACVWYRLNPVNPLPGLRRLSENTNNLMTSFGRLMEQDSLKVLGARLVLALTFPGALMTLLGWMLLQRRRGQRAWLNVWMALSLLSVGMTLQANTYWAYAIVPAACLVTALGVAELARRSRWSLVPVATLLVLGLWVDPGTQKVKQYLATDPAMGAIGRELSDRIQGRVLYYGEAPRDIEYFVRRPGSSVSPYHTYERQQGLLKGHDALVTMQMAGSPLLDQLFTKHPVLATRQGYYALYGLRQEDRLGEPVPTPTSPTLGLNLEGRLIVRDCVATLEGATDPVLTLEITWERGPDYQSPPALAIDFVNTATDQAFFLTPTAHGAAFQNWPVPQEQTPDFDTGAVERMRYTFRPGPNLPGGTYAVRLRLLQERNRQRWFGDGVRVDQAFQIERPPVSAPARLDLAHGLWLAPALEHKTSWLGRRETFYRLNTGAELTLHAALPAGQYTLALRGAALPLGTDAQERWPVIRVRSLENPTGFLMRFDSEDATTLHHTLQWRGEGDFLRLSITNPLTEWNPPVPFPLYLSDRITGIRAVRLIAAELGVPAP